LNLFKDLSEEALIIAHYNISNGMLLQLSNNINIELATLRAELLKENAINKLLEVIKSDYGITNKIIHLAAPIFNNIRFKDIDIDCFQNEIEISLKSIILILNIFVIKIGKVETM
jgi:3-oxoacyl-[acyl-carrier protein] reductase